MAERLSDRTRKIRHLLTQYSLLNKQSHFASTVQGYLFPYQRKIKVCKYLVKVADSWFLLGENWNLHTFLFSENHESATS